MYIYTNVVIMGVEITCDNCISNDTRNVSCDDHMSSCYRKLQLHNMATTRGPV